MNWSLTFEAVSAVALVAGVLFAAYQLVELRRQHKRDAVLGLVRSFQSGDFTAALGRVNSLPDGADLSELLRRPAGLAEFRTLLAAACAQR